MFFIIVISIIEFLSLIALVSFGVSIFSHAHKAAPAPAAKAAPIVRDEPLKETEQPHLPEFVGHIDAEEADHMISDELALAFVVEEAEGHKTIGLKGHINLGDIDKAFKSGEVVTLEKLKAKQLVNKKVKRLKVLADGVLNKPLIIRSHSFSIQAIKMIELTGGKVVKLK